MPAVELFANQPSTTVTAGGTTNNSGGTDTVLTVSSSSAFPPVSNSTSPPTMFRIIDPAAPSEIMQVTNVVGSTWTVVRGAESTIAVAHSANWTAQQVVTAGSFQQFKQSELLGVSSVVPVNTTTETNIVSVTPVAPNQPAAGVVYEFNVYGTIATTSSGPPTLTLYARWNGTMLAEIITGTHATALLTSMGNAGFWVEGYVNCLSSTSMVAGMSYQAHKVATLMTGVSATGDTSTTGNTAMAGITVSGTGPLTVSAKLSSATGNSLAAAGMIQRVQ